MTIRIMLLVAHDSAIIPGQRSIFVAADKTATGWLCNNFGLTQGYSLNPVMTSSIITLGAIINPEARFQEKVQEIGGAIRIPARPPGAQNMV